MFPWQSFDPKPSLWSVAAVVVAYCGLLFGNFWLGLGFLLLAFTILVSCAIIFLVNAARRRWRKSLGALTGIGVLVFGFWALPFAFTMTRSLQFSFARPAYEKMVAEERSAASGPVRLVVYYRDHSLFATSNSFEYIVYDEKDHPDEDERFWWPYRDGVIAISSDMTIQPLGGHYYRIFTSS